jgi:hypothetical protein
MKHNEMIIDVKEVQRIADNCEIAVENAIECLGKARKDILILLDSIKNASLPLGD